MLNLCLFTIFIVILNFVFFTQHVSAKESLIWENDEIVKSILTGKQDFQPYRKIFLETEIKVVLNSTLEYTNLADCLETALNNSYNIELFSHKKNIKKWDYWNKTSKLLPDFYYDFDIGKLSGEFLVGNILPIRVNEIPIQSVFGLSWDITNQGRTIFEMLAGKKYIKSSNYNLEYTIDEVVLNTALNYYDLLGKKLEIDVYRINLKDRTEQLKIAKTRYLVGVGSKFDITRAEAEVAKAEQEYVAMFNNLRFLQARLANVMGVDVFKTLYPFEDDIHPIKLVQDDNDIESLYKLALENRDDIKSKKTEIEALKIKKKEIYSDFIPSILITAAQSDVGTVRLGLRRNNSITLTVHAPLGKNSGANSFTALKQQSEEIKVAEIELIQLERQVKENIVKSYYTQKTNEEKIKAAQKEVKAADESLKIGLVKLEIGEVTFLDIIQAQKVKVEARQRLIQNMIDYNKAQIQLLFDTGIITSKAVLVEYSTPNAQPSKSSQPMQKVH